MAKLPRPGPPSQQGGGWRRGRRGSPGPARTHWATAATFTVLLSLGTFYTLSSIFSLVRGARGVHAQFPQVYATDQSAWHVASKPHGQQLFDEVEKRGIRSQDQPAELKVAAATVAAPKKKGPPVLCNNEAPTVEEMLAAVDLFGDNLDKDLEAWEEGYTMEDIQATAKAAHSLRPEAAFLVQISGGKVTLPQMTDGECTGFCSERTRVGLQQMRTAIEFGRFRPPDTLFVWNVWDHALCTSIKCTAPVLSLAKLDPKRNTVMDILVPLPTSGPAAAPNKVAWEQKKEVAWFRGAPDCTGDPHIIKGKEVECSRTLLPKLSRTRPDMDVVSDFDFSDDPGKPDERDLQAKYKYLFNLEGSSVSHQLDQLLSTNSLVLKQASDNVEYFYGSIKPCVHYIPFWEKSEEDVYEVLDALPQQDELVKKIVANAEAFASRHLNEDAHWRYWEEVLRRVNSKIRASQERNQEPADADTQGDGAAAAN